MKNREVPENLKRDFGTFLDSMIDDLAKEIDAPIQVIIEALSNEYGVSVADMRKCLKLVKSKFTLNNNVVYWDHLTGVYVKRTNHLAKVHNVIKKIGYGLRDFTLEDMQVDTVYPIIEAVFTNSACFDTWHNERRLAG